MRKRWINLLAPVLLLTATTMVASQPPAADPLREPKSAPAKDKEAPTKSKLEEMLEIALKNNPDIKVAQTKALEADAEVDRARLAVAQKVVVLYHDMEMARANMKVAEQEVARLLTLLENKVVDRQTVDESVAKLTLTKAKLAKLEAEIPYLLGQPKLKGAGDGKGDVFQGLKGLDGNDRAAVAAALQAAAARLAQAEAEATRTEKLLKKGNFDGDPQVHNEILNQVKAAEAAKEAAKAHYELVRMYASPKVDVATVNGPMGDKIRATLDKGPMTLTIAKGWGPEDLVLFCRDKYGIDLNILIKDKNLAFPDSETGVRLDDISFGAALQWAEDSLPKHCFVVRDYGLVLMRRDQVPPDALMLNEFWKATRKAKEEKK